MDKNQLKRIRSMCESLNFPQGQLTDSFLFSILGMDHFFFEGNIGAKDIQDGYVDGNRDGGIDFIYVDNNILHLVQAKTTDSLSYC